MGVTSASQTVPEQRLLDAARGGDQDAFRLLVEPYRAELHAHCYRMLGSVHDAEDALQNALLRAWRGLAGLEYRGSLRAWLYRIATNASLDALARRPKRVLPIDYRPPGDPDEGSAEAVEAVWVEPYPDEQVGVEDGYAGPEARYEQRESIELAFIAALQHLAPRQRAVLILRDVLGFSAREVAEALDTSTASVNSGLQRARKTIDERLPERSQQATLRSLGDERIRELVQRFTDAFERGDVDAILAMLAEDVTFAMPPYEGWCRGRDAVARSWLMPTGPAPRLRYVPTRANGQPAAGVYLRDDRTGRYLPLALDVITLRGTTIVDVIAFRTPEVFGFFGLPEELGPAPGEGTRSWN
ncbi:MAG: sigma-70 family RNA polymerase sigma factor [Thermoleophilaceae bacterium]|nr:sigma-70 family RNA polymerase sigma factor [Thermoleophilaceae bacterium]